MLLAAPLHEGQDGRKQKAEDFGAHMVRDGTDATRLAPPERRRAVGKQRDGTSYAHSRKVSDRAVFAHGPALAVPLPCQGDYNEDFGAGGW